PLELLGALRAGAFQAEAEVLDRPESERVNEAGRARPGRDRIDDVAVVDPREGLGHLAARGVSGAQKEDLLFRLGHGWDSGEGWCQEGSRTGDWLAFYAFPSDNDSRLSQTSFWKSRLASEAVGILLLLAGLLATLALASYDPRDPNIFSWTAGGEAAAPNNWIGGFGASLAAALYAVLGFAAWGAAALLFVLGWRRFWARPLPNPATKAAGIGIALFSVPMLLSLAFGRRHVRGDEMEAGGLVGRAFADAF